MTYHLNKTEARIHARNELVIFDEVSTIMRKIILASDAGAYQLTVDGGTAMTTSTPDIVITGTVNNPVIVPGETVSIEGNTIALGTSGTNINAIVADINDAGITNVVASKNADGQLVLTYTPSASDWSLTIGAGSANTKLGLSASIASPSSSPDSVSYYGVWVGSITDRKRDDEMTQVIKYFENRGYNITRIANSITQNTFNWVIYW